MLRFLSLVLAVSLCGCGTELPRLDPSEVPPRGVEHVVLRDDQKIYIWEKSLSEAAPVVVLLHGATWSGRPDFDLQIRDYSAMDALARAGFAVFCVDVQGYGKSDDPRGSNWSRTADAAQDVAVAIDKICAMRGVEQVNLLGWSWGSEVAGTYASDHPDRVERLILFGFTWGEGFPKRPAPSEKYRSATVEAAKSDFIEGCYEPDVVDTYVAECMRVDPSSPNGVLVDYSQHLPLVDPTRITMPLLMLYGEHEVDEGRSEDYEGFLSKVPHAKKSAKVLPGGGHAILLETPHRLWQNTVIEFFSQG